MNVLARFGVPTIINACGTATRVSGGLMHPEVAAAMTAASVHCVDMLALQAGASRVIARVTGAQAGIVTSGASAAILLGAAACLAGLDPARMNQLPATDGRNEFIVVRSQRNMYDRALAVAGGSIVEVGIADRYAGAGVRDAAAWDVAAAITQNTAGIYYLAQPQSLPALADVAAVARDAHVPLLVDAAAQLPPAENLRRFLAEGADLVAFSGGKAIGGPQSSGILCGRRDLVGSALIQMLDLDMLPEQFQLPEEFSPLAQLPGLPRHGIGRACKVGKEEIVGLLVALERFVAIDDQARRAAWRALLDQIVAIAGNAQPMRILDRPLPVLEIATESPNALAAHLAANDPPIIVSLARRHDNVVLISPAALAPEHAPAIAARLCAAPGAIG